MFGLRRVRIFRGHGGRFLGRKRWLRLSEGLRRRWRRRRRGSPGWGGGGNVIED